MDRGSGGQPRTTCIEAGKSFNQGLRRRGRRLHGGEMEEGGAEFKSRASAPIQAGSAGDDRPDRPATSFV
jgi:hypothetical protein